MLHAGYKSPAYYLVFLWNTGQNHLEIEGERIPSLFNSTAIFIEEH